MKRIMLLLLIVLTVSCVQKSYKRTVVFTLNVSGIKDIQKVGIRGNDKPLSWDNDMEMNVLKKIVYIKLQLQEKRVINLPK